MDQGEINTSTHMPKGVVKLKEKESALKESMTLLDTVCLKNYLYHLSDYQSLPFKEEYVSNQTLSLYKITKIVYEKESFFPDKMSMLFDSLHAIAESVFLIMDGMNGNIDFYLGARDRRGRENNCYSGVSLQSGLEAYFPGVVPQYINVNKCAWANSLKNPDAYLSAVSGVASLKDDKKNSFLQGIEHLIEGTRAIPTFSAVFIADSVSIEKQVEIRQAYEAIYSSLTPWAEKQITYNESHSKSINESITKGISESVSKGASHTVTDSSGKSKSEGESESDNGDCYSSGTSSQESTTTNHSKTTGTSHQTTSGNNNSTQSGQSLQASSGVSYMTKHENKIIKEQMCRIDRQLKRIAVSEANGMWSCAAYFISNTKTSALKLAEIYKGLMHGKDSGLEASVVNMWSLNGHENLKSYLKHYIHPMFQFNDSVCINAGSLVSSEELTLHLSLPQKSIPGVLVQERATFARNVWREKEPITSIPLGEIYHLDKTQEENIVSLNMESLSKHTFVTGITGSGKSNAVYGLLKSLPPEIPYLVIEPTKGEYKHIFGKNEQVNVFGVNPHLSPLLHINPFAFPSHIHVAEHIDRLIEIFNVCWPMYAAMPAVLKESVERAYRTCGWDMIYSVNKHPLFPTFDDVLFELKKLMDSTEYSADTKGDYKGALETRLRSLTNGLLGQVFTATTAIEDEVLFNQRTIVDLSRVGSSETKSMLMGMIILKLNEFRMSEGKGMNLPLQHITVLEEAHHLLRRTSKEQSSESSNLIGKSVEMIANSIAEMRTYGEGFIIADQSPSMLDEVAVRNTNTKIILSLPDKDDRELIGKAVGLKDNQIDEISKLPRGVAVAKQDDWQEAVLCKIYDQSNWVKEEEKKAFPTFQALIMDGRSDEIQQLLDLLFDLNQGRMNIEPPKLSELIELTRASCLPGRVKQNIYSIMDSTSTKKFDRKDCVRMIKELVGEETFEKAWQTDNQEDYKICLAIGLKETLNESFQRNFTTIDDFSDFYLRNMFSNKI